ncbi:MAG: hypothetical protein MJY99_08805 [Fibrobacter sp.]|nr:hypothetical protein [Fibrobacter sp.]
MGAVLNLLTKVLTALMAGQWVFQSLGELGKKILGILGLGGAVTSGVFNLEQVKKLLEGIADPQEYLLDYIHSALEKLPWSINALLSSADSMLSSVTSGYFRPSLTVTYLVQVFGVGECINQLLMSAIQNTIFVFSVYLVRWAFANNFTYVQTPPKR